MPGDVLVYALLQIAHPVVLLLRAQSESES
jgi:hypothetical protein